MDDEGDEVIGGEDGEGEDNADGGVRRKISNYCLQAGAEGPPNRKWSALRVHKREEAHRCRGR